MQNIDSEFVDALTRLLDFFLSRFGPDGTLLLFFGLIGVLAVRRWYYDQRSDRILTQLLKEKERTIQRIAGQERQGRILYLVSQGMNRAEAELIIHENLFATPQEAREVLERRRGVRNFFSVGDGTEREGLPSGDVERRTQGG